MQTAPVLEESVISKDAQQTGCPYHAATQKTLKPGALNETAVSCDSDGVWHIRSYETARTILRSSSTTQLGFNAEMLKDVPQMGNQPILYLDGAEHQMMRKNTARFFTPKAVKSYDEMIAQFVDELLGTLRKNGRIDLNLLTMQLATKVAATVVGLTNSSTKGMSRRLNAFFSFEILDPSKPFSLSRLWQTIVSQLHMSNFYYRDVRPAIRAREQTPQDDLISHLLEIGYKPLEILTECVTFGAAGMVTTREFIAMCAWHFLQNDALRDDYLQADHATRHDILHEILRLEPVVSNLHRRAIQPIELEVDGKIINIPVGAKINMHIHATNQDEEQLGTPTDVVCPHRDLPRGVHAAGMSFGDGAHRCPGAYIAIEETDVFLTRFLKMDGLRIVQEPSLSHNELIQSYELRNFIVAVD